MGQMAKYSPPHGSTGHIAYGHIYHGTLAAHGGNYAKAEDHIVKAHESVGAHVTELTKAGKHSEATEFNTTAQSYLMKLDSLIDTKRPKAVKKSFGAPSSLPKQGSRMEKPSDLNDKTKPKVNRNPGHQPNMQYKAFHEMTPEDQTRALHAHGEKDMLTHLYPHDPKSGSYEYGKRWLAPKELIKKPQANTQFSPSSAVQPQLAPQHRVGAGIRVSAEGHELHGKMGMVQAPNPSMPGKIAIKVQNKGRFENHFMEPHEVKSSKLASMSKSEVREKAAEKVTLEKSKNVLAFIRNKTKE